MPSIRLSAGCLLFLWSMQLERRGVSPGGSAGLGFRGSDKVPGFSDLGRPRLQWAGRGRSPALPCPGEEQRAGPERTGRGGPGTRGGAGPHTGRGGWLGPLRSRRRLEEEARRRAEEGRRRRTRPSADDHFPGSAGKGTRARWLSGPAPSFVCQQQARGWGRCGRDRGPARPRRARLTQGCGGQRGVRAEGWGELPFRRSRGAAGAAPPGSRGGKVVWPGVTATLRRGLCCPGPGAADGGPAGPAGCGREGSPWAPQRRTRWAQTKPGEDAREDSSGPEGGYPGGKRGVLGTARKPGPGERRATLSSGSKRRVVSLACVEWGAAF
jgi:hypothetical protein